MSFLPQRRALSRPSRSRTGLLNFLCLRTQLSRSLSTSHSLLQSTVTKPAPESTTKSAEKDPRARKVAYDIEDKFARVKEHYDAPKHPIVLAHGLLGFSELRLLGSYLPTVHYWSGIKEALLALDNLSLIITEVPPSGSIAVRAQHLREQISSQLTKNDKNEQVGVNIIAHSMGGLDARYMISHLQPTEFSVKSLVTIATPHHGSSYADFLLHRIGPERIKTLYNIVKSTGLETDAFDQLTTSYMKNTFNPSTPDSPSTRYFSYGASIVGRPPLLSPFRGSHKVILDSEGRNDGLVSIKSSMWGGYKGTLVGVNHLELINWSNRLRWTVKGWLGEERKFNAVAFYLGIADMLAREGL